MKATLEQAITLHRAGRTTDAVRCYEEVIAADPDSNPARHGFAVLLLQLGRFADARGHLEHIVEKVAAGADVFNALGIVHQQTGDRTAASNCFEQALNLDPNHSKALANLGVTRYQLEEFEGSLDVFVRAVQSDPNNAETLYGYGQTLRALGNLDKALEATRRALSLSPNHVRAHIDLGITLMAMGQHAEAEAQYEKALVLDPKAMEAHHYLAHIKLQRAQLAEGWIDFEWRWQTPDFKAADSFFSYPAWDGAPLSTGSVLVWAEQGVGDQIMYASMLPDLERTQPELVLACAANLVPLFGRSFPWAKVVSMTAAKDDPQLLDSVCAQIPIGSLGRLFRPDMTAFPDRPSFLIADQDRASDLRAKYIREYGDRPLVGLSWHSGNAVTGGAQSLDLVDMAPGLGGADATFIDLQYGDTAADRQEAGRSGLHVIEDPDIDPLADLDGFAAQVAAMDLVITISNTTAHVAGALGVPCWTMLPSGVGQNWYWFLDRDDSPWYPSLRLFRQVVPGKWTNVIEDVGAAFAAR